MARALRHRGPDDEGYIACSGSGASVCELIGDDSQVPGTHIDEFADNADLFIAHRRLSVIDISSAGHQPMANSDRSLWIAYNGEIYNYLELKDELISLGYHFKTRTDTEVVLAAYEVWGPTCVLRFNGMWAFVIFDAEKRKMIGFRDRFGVKPLYYLLGGNFFAFASEIKALLVVPYYSKAVNNEAVYDYLVRGREEGDEHSIFKGVFELPPSHSFEYDCDSGLFRTKRYYTLAFNDSWEFFDSDKYADLTAEVRHRVFRSIEMRLRSDVPVGTCLSGGIDSSSIVCVVNELIRKKDLDQIGEKQKVFTASYKTYEGDESKWAECVVNKTKTSWHRTFPSADDLLNDLEDLVWLQDTPFGSTSIYAQYRVMKLAKENGVKVLLDGQGGDEVFTGYLVYYRALFMEMMANRGFFDVARQIRQLRNAPIALKALILSVGKHSVQSMIPGVMKEMLRRVAKRSNPYIREDFSRAYSYRNRVDEYEVPNTVNGTLHSLMTGTYLKTLLRYEDRNSMHFSLESRTPFADDIDLIEYMFQVPSVYKMRDCWSKSLLRDSMRDVIPQEIRMRRDKIGFSTPERSWLSEIKGELRNYMTANVDDYFNTGKVLKDWDSLFDSRQPEIRNFVWKLLNYSIFTRIHGL